MSDVTKCEWDADGFYDESVYGTSCGKSFFFESGSVKGNNFIYCPYCGKEIYEAKPKQDNDDE